MTKEELKAHCEKQINECEMWAKYKGEEPHGKVYEEHKLILELLEQESILDKIKSIVAEWKTDTWTDNFSFECMIKIAVLIRQKVRMRTKQASEITVGDEVMTKFAERGVAVRDTYYLGKDREPFTLIWFGTYMSSCSVNNVKKTGKHYPQIAEIMEELRCAESEEGAEE